MDTRTLVVALACLVAGAGLGWLLGSPSADGPRSIDADPDDATPAEAPEQTAVELDSHGAVVASLRKQVDDARSTIGDLTAERDALREQVDRLKADADAGRLAGGDTEARTTTRFAGGRFAETLDAIDWQEAGQALSRMAPLLSEFVTSRMEGKPPPPSVGDIQKYNGALVKMALKAQQDGVPGSGANGAFTHVAIVANLVHATLAQAGLPLDAAQEERLAALADRLLEEDEKRLAGQHEQTLTITKLLDETRIKDRFYAGVDALVTDEQREALHPAALRGRTSYDLFSSGLVWAQHVAPQPFREKAQLEQALVQQVMLRYGVAADQRAVVEEVVAAWVADLPASLVAEPPDGLETQVNAHRVTRVRAAAVAQQRGFERLLQRLAADDPAVAKIRAEARVAVPMLQVP